MQTVGFQEIGAGRIYETMVFSAAKNIRKKHTCCPFLVNDHQELDMDGYNDAESAFKGHNRMCLKWSKK